MQRTHVVLSALGAATLLTGCPNRDVSRVDPRQSNEQVKDIPINLSRDIDILFVIDNSISMGQEQDSLRANFPRFIEVLEGIEGGLPSVHIAVVSSDVGIGSNEQANCHNDGGDDGNFRQGLSGCPEVSGNFIEAGGGGGGNFSGDLASAFSCMANLGDQGCGFEQHLESMKRALTKADSGSGGNSGFLRDDAYLAVIVIADEDDCSATETGADQVFDTSQDGEGDELGFFSSFRCWEYGVECNDDNPGPREMLNDGSPGDADTPGVPGTPSARINCVPRDDSPYMAKVGEYVSFLRGLKRDPNRVLVAGIIGDPEPVAVQRRNIDQADDMEYTLMPSCSSGSGEAAPATRLKAFLDGFPNRSVQQTICEEDLSGGLTQIADLLARVVGSPCLEGDLIDLDENAAGVQPDCRVTDYQFKDSVDEVQTSMPSCDQSGGTKPCYRLTEDAACAEFPTGLSISVERDGETPPETTVGVRCAAE